MVVTSAAAQGEAAFLSFGKGKSQLRRVFLSALLSVGAVISLPAQVGAGTSPSSFSFDLLGDGLILGGALAINSCALLLESQREPIEAASLSGVDISLVNPLDRAASFPYSAEIDAVSKVLAIGALASPAILIASPRSEWAGIGVMYAESLLWAWGLKELGKNLFERYRPYVYTGSLPEDAASGNDFLQSFPSGHTTLAFTGAAFASFVLGRYFPESRWTLPATVACYALAAGTAVSRVASGEHFITDALAGAAIGAFAGYIVPWMHAARPEAARKRGKAGLSFNVLPSGIYAKYTFPPQDS